MASSHSVFTDDDVYSRESTDRNGIHHATERERILGWHFFLNLVWKAGITIIPPSELTVGGACRLLGRGATMIVAERVWKPAQSRTGGGYQGQPVVVAVKRLIVRFADSEDDLQARPKHELALLANFSLELRALCHGTLRSHTNIVRLLGVTWAEKGLPSLVLERASEDAPTLASLVESRKLGGVQKADILAGITEGFTAIHHVTLVHGDLKPSNVLIFEQGTRIIPKLSDFAFSRSWQESSPSGGTEYWNAPECCEFSRSKGSGDPEQHPSYRDLFSLGLIFWYLLKESLPFTGIGEETDRTNDNRRKITEAKESGYLLQLLGTDENILDTPLFKSDFNEEFDDDDAALSIVECIEYLVQPKPSKRLNRYIHIPQKLRTRRRLIPVSSLIWDGSKLHEDIWPDMEKDIEDLRLQAEKRVKTETGIRFNLDREPSLKGRLGEASLPENLKTMSMSSDTFSMLKSAHEGTLHSTTSSTQERADAAWSLAQLAKREQPTKQRELLLQAAKLGSHYGQVNYLYHCFRHSSPVAVDDQTHQQWLIVSLTGQTIFGDLHTYPISSIRNCLVCGFQDFFDAQLQRNETAGDTKDFGTGAKFRIGILQDAFVRDFLGGTYAPHDQVLTPKNRWGTIVTAKKKTFHKFRGGIERLAGVLGRDALHQTAMFGTGDVVRDLIRTHKLDIETKARIEFHPGEATALQAALLRHNMSTIQALVNLGADVLPLFSSQTLEAFLIEGDRALLHWLNHLIPLMVKQENAIKARKSFDSMLLSSNAVQCTVVQSNWSLFLGILELRPPLSDEELKPALELVACLRRTEFLLALLILDRKRSNLSQETLITVLCLACLPRKPNLARDTIFPRHYMGLQPEFIKSKSAETTPDIAYGRLMVEMVLQHARQSTKYQPESLVKPALLRAVFFNRMPLAKWLISHWGADPLIQDENGETILSQAVFRGKPHAVKYILKLPGASKMLEYRNIEAMQPIHLAADEGHTAIIKLLLSAGATATSPGFKEQNVLHLCARLVSKRAFCTLFDHLERVSPETLRTMVNQKDCDGTTPLHWFLEGSDPKPGTTTKSACSQDINMARILSTKLLKYVDDIDVPDEWGFSPLHYLVLFNNADMPQTLMVLHRHGADFLRRHPSTSVNALQMMMLSGRAESCMALFSAQPDSSTGVEFMVRAISGGRGDGGQLQRVLREKTEIQKERAQAICARLRVEFRANHQGLVYYGD